jgi:hypothetical protein
LPTRSKRFHVPGGKASVIVDNSTGEIKGIGGMGFCWDEEVDSSRFVKLFLDGIKQRGRLSAAEASWCALGVGDRRSLNRLHRLDQCCQPR